MVLGILKVNTMFNFQSRIRNAAHILSFLFTSILAAPRLTMDLSHGNSHFYPMIYTLLIIFDPNAT